MKINLKDIDYISQVLAREVGDQLSERWNTVIGVGVDNVGRLTTEIEEEMNEYLVNRIVNLYPECNVITSSGQKHTGTSQYTWYLSSLDGAKYYIRKIPLYAVSISLAEKGTLICGVTYNPVSHQMYSGIVGDGYVLRNFDKVKINAGRSLKTAMVVFDTALIEKLGFEEKRIVIQKEFEVLKLSYRARAFGCAPLALAWLASGMFDAFIDFTGRRYQVAVNAGLALVSAAGGVYKEVKIKNFPDPRLVVAANKKIMDNICTILES